MRTIAAPVRRPRSNVVVLKEAVRQRKKRALRIAVPIVVLGLVAGLVFAFFAGGSPLSSGEWKTASGASLQVPTAGAPKLVFTAQPAAGSTIAVTAGVFSVSVALQDSHGTTLISDSVDTVTLALGRDPGHGVLHCTSPGGLTAAMSAGQVTFSGCSISRPGQGYQLTASSSVKPALAPPANGHSFDVVTAAAAKAAARMTALKARETGRNRVTATPGSPGAAAGGNPDAGSMAAGAELTFTSPAVTGAATSSPTVGPITVQLTAAGGTPVTSGVTVQLSSSSTGTNEFSATAGGTPVTLVVIPAGASAVTFYYGDELAGQPVITAAADGVSPARQTETITPGQAAPPPARSPRPRPGGTPGSCPPGCSGPTSSRTSPPTPAGRPSPWR
jgi:hypothetical protein